MNKNLFTSQRGRGTPVDAINDAGATAYAYGPKHALAQMAVTGCMNNTYYVSAETQLGEVLTLAAKVDPEFVAKLAVYARQNGFMKDTPAVLVASLMSRDTAAFKKAFRGAIDDFKMLKNFIQVVRSGVTGRKSLGTAAKKEVQRFFDRQTDGRVFDGSIGQDPSMSDVLKLTHPKPKTQARSNLYAYLLGREFKAAKLPDNARAFEAFKKDSTGVPPEVNFQLLSNIKMTAEQWATLASTMTWTSLRMNLNTLARNGAFTVPGVDVQVAKRLADAKTIAKVKVFPYQLLAAYKNTTGVPARVTNALQDALEIATENTPELPGKTVVAVDTSGSMKSPITGNQGTATSAVQCVDVAALYAACILRKNPDTEIIPFDTHVHRATLNGRDSVATNASTLARFGGGGTDCAAVLTDLNARSVKADTVIYVSDNESLPQFERNSKAGATFSYYGRSLSTGMADEWAKFKKRNPKAKLVLIDIQPNTTTQKSDDPSVLNVGGFNDRVFEIVNSFLRGELGGDHFVKAIDAVEV